jgi:hypothetical protein
MLSSRGLVALAACSSLRRWADAFDDGRYWGVLHRLMRVVRKWSRFDSLRYSNLVPPESPPARRKVRWGAFGFLRAHIQMSVEDAYAWILYVDPQVHVNEYRLVRNAGLEDFIYIQDVKLCKGPRPQWLQVLPAIVDTAARLAYRGPTCLKKLLAIDLPPEHLKRLKRR